MPFRPPRQPEIDPLKVEAFGQVVDRYYETADAYLGELLDGRDENWTVMIVSDHGFASDSTRPRSTDSRIGHGAAADWHRRFGILILSGAHVQPGATIEEASVYDVAPTILALFGQPVPRSWPGKVLWQALEPAFLDEHPVRYRNEDPEREELLMADGETPIDPAAAELVQKLQTLGYVSSGTGDAEDSLTARNNAGVALMAEGRYAEAEQEFRAGLEIEPLAAMLRFNLGMTLYFQGRTDEATARFTEALGAPSTMRMAGLMLAQIRLRGGNPEAASELLERVLATEPDAADLRNLLGVTLERRGDVEGARKEYLHAARLDPDVAMPRNNLGNLAKLAGDLETAEQWYLRAIEADPYFMPAYNNLALVYQDRGQLDRALDLYGRALGKAPNNAELLNNVGSWYYQSGDHDEAQKLWQRAALVDPTYPSPLNNLASLRINAQAYADAERLLRRALELDPGYGDARINLSLVLRRRGQPEAALAELRLATADPLAAPTAWLQLGFLELERGFVDAAIEALDQAGSLLPGNVQVLNGLGEAYRRKGQRDLALEMWRRSLTLDPSQARVRQSLEALEQAEQPG